MRRNIIAGNWKMNKIASEAKTLIKELKPLVKGADAEVIICVPYTDLTTALKYTKGSKIKVGAENVHWEKSGAFTGEISAEMLTEIGVQYVIIGHSERRQYFGETDETVNKRTKAAISNNLCAIVCIGETLEERESQKTEAVLKKQIINGLKDIKENDFNKIIIAYEPVWAIGTGKTATSEDANKTIGFIRNEIATNFGQNVADQLSILYGGSMNDKNVDELMKMPEIDGGLIGGASLVAEKFARVVNFVK